MLATAEPPGVTEAGVEVVGAPSAKEPPTMITLTEPDSVRAGEVDVPVTRNE